MSSSHPYLEKRPWGEFVEYTRNSPSTVKIITVNPGEALSLQSHKNRDEFWHVISGEGLLQIGLEKKTAATGSDHRIPRGTVHRIEAGTIPLVILEISSGEFDDNDIVRIEDKYGRANSS